MNRHQMKIQVAGTFSAAAVGTFAVREPPAALATAAAIGLIAVVPPRRLVLAPFIVAVAGSFILGYGFANTGIVAGVPIPLADVCLGVLLTVAVVGRTRTSLPSGATAAMLGLLVLAAARLLLHDYGLYGVDALRDFTTPLEICFLFVGVWVIRRFGIQLATRILTATLGLALGYFCLYPFREQLATIPISVGLQQPVPLLGQYSGAGTAAAAGLFFFAFVRPTRGSLAVAGAFGAMMFMFQSRGLFIAVPAAGLVVWTLVGPRAAVIRRRLLAFLVAASAASALLFLIAPDGRLGTVSPSLVVAQLGTLLGHEGPGSGTIDSRVNFRHDAFEMVQDTRFGWLIGVGLGPDLAGGFSEGAVRKPHDDYLEVFARLGVVGLTLFLFVIGRMLLDAVRGARRLEGQPQRFLWFVIASSAVYLIVAATQPLLAFPYGTIPLFVLLGMAHGVSTSPPATGNHHLVNVTPAARSD